MGLSTKRRLALSTMIDLALCERAGPVALRTIALRHQVSLSCIEQLSARLRKAGLVKSTRGPGGGYTLGQPASAISVAAIIKAADTGARGAGKDDGRAGLADDLSQRLDAMMRTHMAGIALSDLVAGRPDAGVIADVARPRRSAIAPRPQPRPVAVGVPNSVFELGTAMASAGAQPDAR